MFPGIHHRPSSPLPSCADMSALNTLTQERSLMGNLVLWPESNPPPSPPCSPALGPFLQDCWGQALSFTGQTVNHSSLPGPLKMQPSPDTWKRPAPASRPSGGCAFHSGRPQPLSTTTTYRHRFGFQFITDPQTSKRKLVEFADTCPVAPSLLPETHGQMALCGRGSRALPTAATFPKAPTSPPQV